MMSQNCKSTYAAAPTRDANNNTLYHGAAHAQPCGGRGYSPPRATANGSYHQQVTAKVLFGSVAAINDLTYKRPEKAEREARRTH